MKLFYINWIRRPWLKWIQMKGPFPYKITKEDLKWAEECIAEIEKQRRETSGDVRLGPGTDRRQSTI
jgi:hypothetical protein